MKNILIIEDEKDKTDVWVKKLEGRINVEVANSLFDAQKIIRDRIEELDIITFDMFLIYCEQDGKQKNTLDLLKETVKAGFRGILIAASGDAPYRDIQKEEGCSYEVERKSELPQRILSLI